MKKILFLFFLLAYFASPAYCAYTEFYMQTTGSNLNSGSSNDDTSIATTTNGNWDSTTGIFIAASGTPFSATTTNDWASVYPDGNTTTPFVGKVTTVTSDTQITIDVATAKFGTAPTTSATARSCKIGGAWANFGMLASGVALNTGTVGQYTRINIKAGTYANTTTDRTFALAGATSTPLWWRGYNTTIGDIDTDNSLAKPAVTFTTGRFITTGNHSIYSKLDISGAQVTGSSGQLRVQTGSNMKFDSIRVEDTAANANGRAFFSSSSDIIVSRSWFKTTSTATDVAISTGARAYFIGSYFEGGGIGVEVTGANPFIAFNVFNNHGGDGINCSGSTSVYIINNSFYSVGGDSIELNPPIAGVVFNNIFSESGAYNINAASTTNVTYRSNNLSHNPTTGNENNFGDSPSFSPQTDSTSPYTDAGSSDFSLTSSTNALNNMVPPSFENQTYTSYGDLGAVGRQRTSDNVFYDSTIYDSTIQ